MELTNRICYYILCEQISETLIRRGRNRSLGLLVPSWIIAEIGVLMIIVLTINVQGIIVLTLILICNFDFLLQQVNEKLVGFKSICLLLLSLYNHFN